ncbi:hypothetical protein SAMN05444126_1481, partial [Salisediminibacterium halotolerans]
MLGWGHKLPASTNLKMCLFTLMMKQNL